MTKVAVSISVATEDGDITVLSGVFDLDPEGFATVPFAENPRDLMGGFPIMAMPSSVLALPKITVQVVDLP